MNKAEVTLLLVRSKMEFVPVMESIFFITHVFMRVSSKILGIMVKVFEFFPMVLGTRDNLRTESLTDVE